MKANIRARKANRDVFPSYRKQTVHVVEVRRLRRTASAEWNPVAHQFLWRPREEMS